MKLLLLVLAFFLLCGWKYEKYVLPSSLVIIDESSKILVAQVGVLEEEENRGTQIFEYQKSVGISQGAPYCAAGQYYCFYKAVKNVNLSTSDIPIKKTGLASSIFYDAKARGKKTKYNPEKHDLIIWKKQIGINGHVERIVETNKKGWVKTIGFNVRNGTRSGVFYKIRNIYHPLQKMIILGLVGFNCG